MIYAVLSAIVISRGYVPEEVKYLQLSEIIIANWFRFDDNIHPSI